MQPAHPARWHAVVLGGGDPDDPLARAHSSLVKPLVPIHGQPMAAYVLRSLRESGQIARIHYVGPSDPGLDGLFDEQLPDQGSLLANLRQGAQRCPPGDRILAVSADIPMLRPDQLAQLIGALPGEAGLVYPIVPKEACDREYPGVKRTYVRLRDGTFTGGNVIAFDPALLERAWPLLQQVVRLRKNPLGLARLIGLKVLYRLLAGQLSLAELEERVSQILAVPVRALVTQHAAIGTDVDKESDLTLAAQQLSGRPTGSVP